MYPKIPDKPLYLDADILFQHDSHMLYDIDIEGNVYTAARDHYGSSSREEPMSSPAKPMSLCFITMKDSNVLDETCFPVQKYTIHIPEPIYPDHNLNYRDHIEDLKQRNSDIWREIYEREYQTKLEYLNIPEID